MTTVAQPTSPPRSSQAADPSPAFSPLHGPAAGFMPDEFNLKDNTMNTMISKEMHLGVNQGDTTAVMEALDKGEVPEAQTEFGEHALHRGVRSGVPDVVDALLDAGASVDSRDLSGKTPLLTVCGVKASNYTVGHLKIVDKLLECGADHLAADAKGHTALGRAAAAGHANIVLLLLKAGCPSDDPDDDGMTPLMHAAKGKHVKIVELLLKADKLAQYRKHPKATTNNTQTSTGKTALMFAAASKRVEMVTLLLINGADSLAEDDKGKTALKYCKKAPDCAAKIEAAASKANGGGGKRR
jgi:ankyrin repeat protein